jgi:hypothetical protein
MYLALALLGYAFSYHVGVQQKYLQENNVKRDIVESLDGFMYLVGHGAKASEVIKWTRWFSGGTVSLLCTIMVGYLHWNKFGRL